jgi:DNA-binding Lrp family transcriptional regulator
LPQIVITSLVFKCYFKKKKDKKIKKNIFSYHILQNNDINKPKNKNNINTISKYRAMLDSQEKAIVAALVKNPRISDNKIAAETGVPLKTVNRKRKVLEAAGIVRYLAVVDNSISGTGQFQGQAMFGLKIRPGITRAAFLEKFTGVFQHVDKKHLTQCTLTEAGGSLMLFVVIESYKQTDLFDILNADIIPDLEKQYGTGCVLSAEKYDTYTPIVLFTNYSRERLLPGIYVGD